MQEEKTDNYVLNKTQTEPFTHDKYMQVHKVPSYQFSKVACYLDGYIFCL